MIWLCDLSVLSGEYVLRVERQRATEWRFSCAEPAFECQWLPRFSRVQDGSRGCASRQTLLAELDRIKA